MKSKQASKFPNGRAPSFRPAPKLKAEWDRILKQSGFDDIEYANGMLRPEAVTRQAAWKTEESVKAAQTWNERALYVASNCQDPELAMAYSLFALQFSIADVSTLLGQIYSHTRKQQELFKKQVLAMKELPEHD